MEKKVLIIDDDEKLRNLLVKYLAGYGFSCLTLPDDTMAMKTIRMESPSIIILDIMLGNANGLDVLKEIRKESTIPVIMLTAKGEETDRIVGLELGADDYLPKPFNPRELLARMNSVLRRSTTRLTDNQESKQSDLLSIGGFTLNSAKRRLKIDQTEIELSVTEYRMIHALMRNPDTVFSRDDLMNIARGKDAMAFDRSVDVHISNLRAKIGEISESQKKKIKTVWGTGYMLEVDE